MTTNSLNNSCWNDFTVRNGPSGGMRKLRVQNEYDIAGSQACVETYVQGTTAADSFSRNVIGAAHSYATGIDTSDARIWKLAYDASATATPSSAGAIMRSTTTGIIDFPLQSRFGAYKSATAANATGDNTEVQVIFDTEQYDVQGEYDTATGIFTATRAGIYDLDFCIELNNLGAAHITGLAKITHNVTDIALYNFNPYNMCNAGSVMYHVCRKVNLGAADTIKIYITVGGGAKTVGVVGGVSVTNFYMCKIA
jgi:hypothetical protein